MNTLKKNTAVIHLPKSNHRWAWMAGATAAAAAAPHTMAQTAQISLIGNTLDSLTGNHISLSTSPGHPFATVASASTLAPHTVILKINLRGVASNPLHVRAYHSTEFAARLTHPVRGSAHDVGHFGASPQTAFGLIPFSLGDTSLPNALNNSNALVEVEAFNQSTTDQTAALLAIFYTESSTTAPSLTINSTSGAITGSYTNVGSSNAGVFTAAVPEPTGSSLALLSLGAGGILARRKLKKDA